MNIGGLGARAALLKHQKHTKKCERCGLYFDRELDKCSHCGHLDEDELALLLERKRREYRGRKYLGYWFIFGAVVVFFLMIIVGRG